MMEGLKDWDERELCKERSPHEVIEAVRDMLFEAQECAHGKCRGDDGNWTVLEGWEKFEINYEWTKLEVHAKRAFFLKSWTDDDGGAYLLLKNILARASPSLYQTDWFQMVRTLMEDKRNAAWRNDQAIAEALREIMEYEMSDQIKRVGDESVGWFATEGTRPGVQKARKFLTFIRSTYPIDGKVEEPPVLGSTPEERLQAACRKAMLHYSPDKNVPVRPLTTQGSSADPPAVIICSKFPLSAEHWHLFCGEIMKTLNAINRILRAGGRVPK
ncbi:hypothetical protein B484DRAFT_177818 [Ochromonadaceae sp. CCMP2298]|nr:hypothetical protein B484DRAFT_177818 [Ochromonadaceae sp. CCMP2298]|mmetsp:Transcript_15070/g.33223  ORF Transcript_15070/g.33223 Transcript_15070/m.33223 type:complete len:272 (-) Transcript_15070:100-915(-)